MSPTVTATGAATHFSGAIQSPIQDILIDLHERYRSLCKGEVASYIPELSKADPNWFGICLATPDGQVYEIGDTSIPFTIQSISKPFVYAAALMHNGPETVLRKVGVEPSGDVFNAISLDPVTGRPANPMINAGAIATTGLLPGGSPADMCSSMLRALNQYAGRDLAINEEVYTSERDTGFRNHAIAYMLRNAGILESDPRSTVDVYFRQCSVEVTCRDLAIMAAVLASGGINPLSGKRVIEPWCVEKVLSLMSTCGMYNFSGEWTLGVGLPAKSGVSGGIITVLPGQFGVAVFSPPLDEKGNSVRGLEVCQELSHGQDLHLFNNPVIGRTVVRRQFTGAEMTSNRIRSAADYSVLKTHGSQIRIYELQGEIMFGAVEIVVRDIVNDEDAAQFNVVDFDRVTACNAPSCNLLAILARKLAEQQRSLIFTQVKPRIASVLQSALRKHSSTEYNLEHPAFRDVDLALDWCETALIQSACQGADEPCHQGAAEGLERFELLQGLTKDELVQIQKTTCVKVYGKGELIVRAGAEDRSVYLLEQGEASAVITLRSGRERRLATFSGGTSFGEMALLGPQTRSANVYADRESVCIVIDMERLCDVWLEHPGIHSRMMENLAADLGQKLRRTNQTVSALAR